MDKTSGDAELIHSCLSGDGKAFDVLFDRYKDNVYRYALAITQSNHNESADIVQESFIRAYRSLASFNVDRSFISWIIKIAYHVFIDKITRDKKKRMTSSIDAMFLTDNGKSAIEIEDSSQSPENVLDKKMFLNSLDEAIDHLPSYSKVTAEMFFKQGMGYDTIAEVLDIPTGTVRSRLFRARQLIRDDLAMAGFGEAK